MGSNRVIDGHGSIPIRWTVRPMRKRNPKIPGSVEWSGYKDDLDVRHAHKLFFGKPISDVQQHFGGVKSIERADELLFIPRQAFQYYVFAFADFVVSDKAIGDSALRVASCDCSWLERSETQVAFPKSTQSYCRQLSALPHIRAGTARIQISTGASRNLSRG
jgi:hypothetical protein